MAAPVAASRAARRPTDPSLSVRSRVMPWGFLVALPLAVGYGWLGLMALETTLLPERVGVFVAPPPGLIGILFLVFALFLFLVGISELARYLRPSIEVVVDEDGVATYGLLGERRMAWGDIVEVQLARDTLSLKARRRGRVPPPDMRIQFSRLDVAPEGLLAAIRKLRPDLVA